MSILLQENKELFTKYAIQDSLITLKHSISMEEFYTGLGRSGVPLTLSTISKAYVKSRWAKGGYKGYQVGDGYLLGNVAALFTPKNIRTFDFSKYLSQYLGSYRGGRNETFMYGVESLKDNRSYIDYDLVSCYTSVMSILGDPLYKSARRLSEKDVPKFDDDFLIYNYIVLEVTFEFPSATKYPTIATFVDKDIDIYPLKGKSIITGSEYLVAEKMGAKITVLDGVIVPFRPKNTENDTPKCESYITPYLAIMKGLQEKRREHPKKSFLNLLYKEIGNSIYGQTSMGISDKKAFDVKTNGYVRINGGELTNPLLASYITGFTRALIGECLGNIKILKGNVVSVTTDGFLTDIEDLENKLYKMPNTHLLKAYQKVRRLLTNGGSTDESDRALEIKSIEKEGITA